MAIGTGLLATLPKGWDKNKNVDQQREYLQGRLGSARTDRERQVRGQIMEQFNAGNPAAPAATTPGAPPPPDYNTPGGIVQAQSQANQINEVNPFGSSSYSTGPDGRVTRTTSMSPEETATLARLNQQRDRSLGTAGATFSQIERNAQNPFNLDGIPQAPGDYEQFRRSTEDKVYDAFKRRTDDQFSRQEQGLQQRLADQGIPVGSERWKAEMTQFSRNRNDANLDAQLTAFDAGSKESQNMFQNQNTLRSNAIDERLLQREQPMQEYQSLMQGVGLNTPQYSQTQPVDVAGIVQPFALNNQQVQLQRDQYEWQKKQSGGGGGGGRRSGGGSNVNRPAVMPSSTTIYPTTTPGQAPQQSSGGSGFGQFVGNVAGSIANGIGNSLAGTKRQTGAGIGGAVTGRTKFGGGGVW